MEPLGIKTFRDSLPAPVAAPTAPNVQNAQATPVPATAPLNRAAGTAPLDARNLRGIGTSNLSIEPAQLTGKVKGISSIAGTTGVAKLGATATALAELGVVGSLAEVAKAYTKTTFDPQAIASSLGKFADNLQHVTSQVQALPGVGDALLALGGVGSIISGVNSLREGISAAKSAQDTPEKVQASLGAAAGAAKILGGLATALTPFCPPLGAVGAAITSAGVAMDMGKLALAGRAPLAQALGGIQFRLSRMIPTETRQAVEQAAKLLSNNGASMVRTQSG